MVQHCGIQQDYAGDPFVRRDSGAEEYRWSGAEERGYDDRTHFRLSERKSLQFRGEATNALNLVNLSNPGTNANTASTFGKITTARAMRQAQVGLKLVF